MNNKTKKRRNDVFRSGLVEGARFAGQCEMPCVPTSDFLPESLIPFDKALKSGDFNYWIHFYLHDIEFERLWNRPMTYLPCLKKYKGVISPDYSLHYDMPYCVQQYNTYRSRALGYWMSTNGIEVIPNVRWGDERSYSFCFEGIEPNKTVAVGTHGCIKKTDDKHYFKLGLEVMLYKLSPKSIIVYGSTPCDLFQPCIEQGVEIHQFDSWFSQVHKRRAG